MARRATTRPQITVIMAVHNAATHVARTVESVLGQEFSRVQLVVADCASTDRTPEMLRRAAERDMRLDVLTLDTTNTWHALDEALDAARGTYLMVMGQDGWLGLQALDRLVEAAEEDNLQLAIPSYSWDTYYSTGERSSRVTALSSERCFERAAFRRDAHILIDNGLFGKLTGTLMERDRIDELGLRFSLIEDEQAFFIRYVEDIDRVGSVEAAVYHAPQTELLDDGPSSAVQYARCEREHKRLLSLIAQWGMDKDAELVHAVHCSHMSAIIACVEATCSARSLSSIERNERVRDIVEAESTRATIEVLHGSHRDFGLLYGPIARKNVVTCCLSAKLMQLVRSSHLPIPGVVASGSAA